MVLFHQLLGTLVFKMKIGNIFGIWIGLGVLIGLCFGKEYMMEGLWIGIALAAIMVYFKFKKDEKK